jgi:hypothetical protein
LYLFKDKKNIHFSPKKIKTRQSKSLLAGYPNQSGWERVGQASHPYKKHIDKIQEKRSLIPDTLLVFSYPLPIPF